MKNLKPCHKCRIKPDVMQAARLTVVKCLKCGACETSLNGKLKTIKQWNKAQEVQP